MQVNRGNIVVSSYVQLCRTLNTAIAISLCLLFVLIIHSISLGRTNVEFTGPRCLRVQWNDSFDTSICLK